MQHPEGKPKQAPRLGAPPRPACRCHPDADTAPGKIFSVVRLLLGVVALTLLGAAISIFLVAAWLADIASDDVPAACLITRSSSGSQRRTDVPHRDP